MSTTVGELNVKVGADTAEAVSNIERLKDSLKTMGEFAGGMGLYDAMHKIVDITIESVHIALDAEKAFNQLKFSVGTNAAGGWDQYSEAVERATIATAHYARVTEQTSQSALQVLITATGDVDKSMKNLNLVFDLAAAKGMDVQAAAMMIGRAMEGNTTLLQRAFPEFRVLSKEYLEHATNAEKAAAAIEFMQNKLAGASDKVGEHVKQHERVSTAIEEHKKSWGDLLLGLKDSVFTDLDGKTKLYMGTLFALTGNMEVAKEAWIDGFHALDGYSDAQFNVVKSTNAVKDATKGATTEQDALTAAYKRTKESEYQARLNADVLKVSIEANTQATTKLIEAKKILADLDKKALDTEMMRGTPEDIMHRIREGMGGEAGSTTAGMQGLLRSAEAIKTTTPGEKEDQERLIKGLTESLRMTAQGDIAEANRKLNPYEGQKAYNEDGGSRGPQIFGPNISNGVGGGGEALRPWVVNVSIGGERIVGVTRDSIGPVLTDIPRRNNAPFHSMPRNESNN